MNFTKPISLINVTSSSLDNFTQQGRPPKAQKFKPNKLIQFQK